MHVRQPQWGWRACTFGSHWGTLRLDVVRARGSVGKAWGYFWGYLIKATFQRLLCTSVR